MTAAARSLDLLSYRRALGAFATGVVVVTAEDADGALGVTVNSFTSVSLEPPLILWCLARSSKRGARLLGAEHFGVNILAHGDRHVSDRFARGDGYRLEPDEVDRWPDGPPRLRGALTQLHCRAVERLTMGDHWTIVAEVLAFDARLGDGLAYFRGGYRRMTTED